LKRKGEENKGLKERVKELRRDNTSMYRELNMLRLQD
jgi:hypothetical protein